MVTEDVFDGSQTEIEQPREIAGNGKDEEKGSKRKYLLLSRFMAGVSVPNCNQVFFLTRHASVAQRHTNVHN